MSEARKVQDIAFVLVPDFSMIAFTGAMDVLRMANWLSGQSLYQCRLVSADGEPVRASNQVAVSPDAELDTGLCHDLVLIPGPSPLPPDIDPALRRWLLAQTASGAALGGMCTGAHLLARAGLLDGYRATVHWWNIAALREAWPRVIVSDALFEIDRDRYTCTGGTASLDMLLHLVARDHGQALAAGICDQFAIERMRDPRDRQRIPLQHALGSSKPKLTEAILLMEANIEEPLPPDELAALVGISRRQLERLFNRHLGCVPSRYYQRLRLARARELLLQTEMPVVQVGQVCGFASGPHFSKCYRAVYELSPSEERRRNAARSPV